MRDRGVAMTPEEVDALLDAQKTVTLATNGPDGFPHLAAMWFALDGDDVLMWTYGNSQKVHNVTRDARASVLAETGREYGELRGVCLDCEVTVVRDPRQILELGRMIALRNVGDQTPVPRDTAPGERHQAPAAVDEMVTAQAAKRVGLRLRPVRTRSWDHSKLAVPRV